MSLKPQVATKESKLGISLPTDTTAAGSLRDNMPNSTFAQSDRQKAMNKYKPVARKDSKSGLTHLSSSRMPSVKMGPPGGISMSNSTRQPEIQGYAPSSTSRKEKDERSGFSGDHLSRQIAAPLTHRRNGSSSKISLRPPVSPDPGKANAKVLSALAGSLDETATFRHSIHSASRVPTHARSVSEVSSTLPRHARTVSQILPGERKFRSLHTSLPAANLNKVQRPEFSTLQRHYTPRKVLKAPSTSLLAQDLVQASSAEALCDEAIHLQTELIHLSFLHQSSDRIQRQWEQSAKRILRSRFDLGSKRHGELRALENEAQTFINIIALKDWTYDDSATEIAEKVQTLSRNIHVIYSLSDPGGKYTRIIDSFESWFVWASRIRCSRNEPVSTIGNETEFVESIGNGWKAELALLERKLISCLEELKYLDGGRESSNLACVRMQSRDLTANMLKELECMRNIESEMMLEEESWIKYTIHRLESDVIQDHLVSSFPTSTGIWHI
ncbi:hypothetical protein MMC12_007820 [Toensbergia leucococca]|nr:hypothetical protein [Toensbergia leucococca]